jgi:precorrin-6B methylase 2
MVHADHVRLLRDGVTRGGTWADLGAGTGAFTLALAELVGPGGEVIAVDRDRGALRELEQALRPGGAAVRTLSADFTKQIDLPSLDGIVMANSLDFVEWGQRQQGGPSWRRRRIAPAGARSMGGT